MGSQKIDGPEELGKTLIKGQKELRSLPKLIYWLLFVIRICLISSCWQNYKIQYNKHLHTQCSKRGREGGGFFSFFWTHDLLVAELVEYLALFSQTMIAWSCTQYGFWKFFGLWKMKILWKWERFMFPFAKTVENDKH